MLVMTTAAVGTVMKTVAAAAETVQEVVLFGPPSLLACDGFHQRSQPAEAGRHR